MEIAFWFLCVFAPIHIILILIVHRLLKRNLNKNEKKWWFKLLIFIYVIITPIKLWGNL